MLHVGIHTCTSLWDWLCNKSWLEPLLSIQIYAGCCIGSPYTTTAPFPWPPPLTFLFPLSIRLSSLFISPPLTPSNSSVECIQCGWPLYPAITWSSTWPCRGPPSLLHLPEGSGETCRQSARREPHTLTNYMHVPPGIVQHQKVEGSIIWERAAPRCPSKSCTFEWGMQEWPC